MTPKQLPQILFYFYLIAFSQALTAQINNTELEYLGLSAGLSSQLCKNLIEDDLGNIWISTYGELNKYDGYNVKPFYFHKDHSNRSAISNLAKDGKGNIWVFIADNTSNKFLDKNFQSYYKFSIAIINPLTEERHDFLDYVKDSESFYDKIVNVFIRERKIYFLTKDGDLFRFDKTMEKVMSNIPLDDFVGLGTNEDIYVKDKESLIHKNISESIIEKIPKSYIDSIDIYGIGHNGNLFMTVFNSQDSASTFIYKNGEKTKIQALNNVKRLIKKPNLYMQSLGNHSIMYSDTYNTLLKYNGSIYLDDELIVLPNDSVIGKKTINNVIQSESGLIYVATEIGVYKLKKRKPVFTQFLYDSKNMNSTRGLIVKDDIQLARVRNKEKITSPSQKYDLDYVNPPTFDLVPISHYIDPNNYEHIWSVGYLSKGVRLLDLSKNKIVEPKINKVIDSVSYLNVITSILRSNYTNKLYIAGETGLAYYNEPTQNFDLITSFYDEFGHSNHYGVNQIINGEECLFLASNAGVIKYFEDSDSFELIKISNIEYDASVQYLHIDTENPEILWIGTTQDGLWKYNLLDSSLQRFDVNDGLSNNSVHTIHQDSHSRLWLSTNNQLSCFEIEKEQFHIFTTEDGITHPEFNRWSNYYNDKSGILYLGGLNGYTYFQPDSIKLSNDRNVHVRLLSAKKTKNTGQKVSMLQEVYRESKIEFLENDFNIELELSTNHHFNIENSTFSHRIKGISSKWTTEASNRINIGRLPYGDYVLEVILNGNSPHRKSAVMQLDIFVIKPIYKRTWFILSLAFVFAYAVWSFFKYRIKNIKRKNALLEEVVSLRTIALQESNVAKNNLLAILAHDLRSPISSLSNLSKKIVYLLANNRIDEILEIAIKTEKKVHSLNDNLNNILMWALAENKSILNRPKSLILRNEVDILIDLYLYPIKEKKLEIINDVIEDTMVYIDKTIFQTIGRNALSNAIKFSKEGGQIHFNCLVSSQFVEFNIVNDFEEDEKKLSNEEGTGRGLKISEDLALLSNAQISLKINDEGKSYFKFIMDNFNNNDNE